MQGFPPLIDVNHSVRSYTKQRNRGTMYIVAVTASVALLGVWAAFRRVGTCTMYVMSGPPERVSSTLKIKQFVACIDHTWNSFLFCS